MVKEDPTDSATTGQGADDRDEALEHSAGSERLVSVVIPTHYRNDLLRDAIDSARRQTHDPVEVIVVDDSGTGHARPVLDEYDEVESIIFDRNRGPQAAREAGFQRSSGRYVQFLDDDDLLLPTKIEKQLPLFSDSVGVVYCGHRNVESGEVVLPDPEVRGDVLRHALAIELWPCNTDTMLTKRSVLKAVAPFPHHHGAEDDGFRIEVARRTEFDYVDEPLVERRKQSPDRRAKTQAYLEGRKRIVESYPELYARYPDARADALRFTYELEAYKHLRDRTWTLDAPRSYLRASRHARSLGGRLRLLASAFGSLLGRPTYERVARTYARLLG